MNKNNNNNPISRVAYIMAAIFAVLGGFGWYENNTGNVNSAPIERQQTEIVNEVSYEETDESEQEELTFKNEKKLNEHFEKHGIEMGFSSPEDYQAAAAAVVNNPSSLHKIEVEDGDDVYYLEETNEFVIVSTKGYIRTYYNPQDGLAYFNRQ